jgi:hypothetical protein
MTYFHRTTALACVLGLTPAAVPAPGTADKADAPAPVTAKQLAASQANLERLAKALIAHAEAENGALPTNVVDKKGKVLLSWRVQLLPYLKEKELYKQFKLDEPWDGDNNKKLIDKMPVMFAPVRLEAEKGETFYQALGGARGWLQSGKPVVYPAAFPDGLANTLLVAEAAKPVIWTKPADLEYDGKKLPKFGGLFDGRFHGARADGTVLRFRADVPPETLRRLIDPADGQVLSLSGALDKDKK